MKFTIHTNLPDGSGGQKLSSRAVEGETLSEAIQLAIQKLRDSEVPIAWSPEPSRSRGGTKGHEELYDEARAIGRRIIYHSPDFWQCGELTHLVKPFAKQHCGKHGIIWDGNAHAVCPACFQDSMSHAKPGVFYDGHVLAVTQSIPATGEVVDAEVDKTPIATTMQERDECGRERDRARITAMASKGFDPFREYIVERGGQAGHYPPSTAGGAFATANSPDMRRTSAQIDPTHAGAAQAWHDRKGAA